MLQENTDEELIGSQASSDNEVVSLFNPSPLKRAFFLFAFVVTGLAGLALTGVQIALLSSAILSAPLWVVPMLLAIMLSFPLYLLARGVAYDVVKEKTGGYKTAISIVVLMAAMLFLLVAAPLLLVGMPAWIMPVLLSVVLFFRLLVSIKHIAAHFRNKQSDVDSVMNDLPSPSNDVNDSEQNIISFMSFFSSSKGKDLYHISYFSIITVALIAVVSAALIPFYPAILSASILSFICIASSFLVLHDFYKVLRSSGKAQSHEQPVDVNQQENSLSQNSFSPVSPLLLSNQLMTQEQEENEDTQIQNLSFGAKQTV